MKIYFLTISLILILLSSGCGSNDNRNDVDMTPSDLQVDPDVVPIGMETNTGVLAQQDLLGVEWTLETVRGTDGVYLPLPLDSTWSLTFDSSGSVSGLALCNRGNGTWQAGDSTLSIIEWSEDGAFCESSEIIATTGRLAIISRLFQGETVMPRIDMGRLFLDTGDGSQLVFSGRKISADEQDISIKTLVSSSGGSRFNNDDGETVFGDLSSPYVVYRDAESLEADFALLRAESTLTTLPNIDFTSSFVVGAYLPFNGSASSDVAVRGAHQSLNGLEISVVRLGPNVPDEAPSLSCGSGAVITAPYTLVRIDSIIEPISFSEVARASCSGIPVGDDL